VKGIAFGGGKMKLNKPKIHDQPKTEVPEKLRTELDKDRQEERLLDTIGDIQQEECLHTPDLLEYIDTEDKGDLMHQIYQCKCGKKVTEVFTLCGSKVSE
jgi:hypothetical protein